VNLFQTSRASSAVGTEKPGYVRAWPPCFFLGPVLPVGGRSKSRSVSRRGETHGRNLWSRDVLAGGSVDAATLPNNVRPLYEAVGGAPRRLTAPRCLCYFFATLVNDANAPPCGKLQCSPMGASPCTKAPDRRGISEFNRFDVRCFQLSKGW